MHRLLDTYCEPVPIINEETGTSPFAMPINTSAQRILVLLGNTVSRPVIRTSSIASSDDGTVSQKHGGIVPGCKQPRSTESPLITP